MSLCRPGYYLAMKGESSREDIMKLVIRGLHKQDLGQKLTAKQLEEASRQRQSAREKVRPPPDGHLPRSFLLDRRRSTSGWRRASSILSSSRLSWKLT